jgi:hypothetical protein
MSEYAGPVLHYARKARRPDGTECSAPRNTVQPADHLPPAQRREHLPV